MEFSCMDSMPIFLCMDVHFVGTVHTNFHAKSGGCSSKNGRVIALGTKEDISGRLRVRVRRRRRTFSSVDNTVQTLKFVVQKFGQQQRLAVQSRNKSFGISKNKYVTDDLQLQSWASVKDQNQQTLYLFKGSRFQNHQLKHPHIS